MEKKSTVGDVEKFIGKLAPKCLQEQYDNSGLQIGDRDMLVKSALVTLDVTEEVLDEAIAKGCNLIVAHHPLLFHPLKHITGESEVERVVAKALKNDVAIYCAHTSLDNAEGGVSYKMAEKMGLKNVEVLAEKKGVYSQTMTSVPETEAAIKAHTYGEQVTDVHDPDQRPGRIGSGVIGDTEEMSEDEALKKVKDIFGCEDVRYCGMTGRKIKRIAMCGGSGSEFIGVAISRGADMYVTGDCKYHEFQSVDNRILLADIGHFESEQYTKEIFMEHLSEKFSNFATQYSEVKTNPINHI